MFSLLSRICQLSKEAFRWFRPTKDFFTFVFFLALSGVIWLLATLNEYYESEVDIPVVISGAPKSVAFDCGMEDTIRAVVHDKGFSFIMYRYVKKIPPVVVEFSAHNRKSGKLVVTNTELKKLVAANLESTSTISSLKPEKLEYSYAQCVSKTVPVILTGTIEPADNYYLALSRPVPDHLTIYLSKAMADSVTHVETEPLNVRNFTDSLSFEANLKPLRGVNFSKTSVMVNLFADILTEEVVEVPVEAVNVPEGVSLRFFPSRVKVKFVVGVSMYDQIDKSDFRVQADYKNIEPGSEKCPIAIVHKPHGVMRASTEVSQLDYLIEY